MVNKDQAAMDKKFIPLPPDQAPQPAIMSKKAARKQRELLQSEARADFVDPFRNHPDAFPRFQSGDVEIMLSHNRKYKLHSIILRQVSKKFANLLEKTNPPLSMQALARGETIRHRLMLDVHDPAEENWTFCSLEVDSEGQSEMQGRMGFSKDSNQHHYSMYHKIFGTFYGYNVGLVTSQGLAWMVEEVRQLLTAAEKIECIPAISKQVEATFLTFGQTLWESCAHDPAEWIVIAFRLQSRILYKECLIHMIGRWPEMHIEFSDRDMVRPIDKLPYEIKQIAEQKADLFKKALQRVEQKLMTHYPPHLERVSVSGRADLDNISRKAYGNDIFGWMALCLWRHYIGQQMVKDKFHSGLDQGGQMLRKIAQGGPAYLSRDEVAQFNLHFPMSNKGSVIILNMLEEIKTEMAKIVKPLLRVECNCDITKEKVEWLVCCRVHPSDYPWEGAADEEEVSPWDQHAEGDLSVVGEGYTEVGGDFSDEMEAEMKTEEDEDVLPSVEQAMGGDQGAGEDDEIPYEEGYTDAESVVGEDVVEGSQGWNYFELY